MNKNTCHDCNGVGLLRNDDPNSDRVYGDTCSSCNGTGIAGSPRLGCFLVVGSAVSTIATIVWLFWR